MRIKQVPRDKKATQKTKLSATQLKVHEIIFEAETFAGKLFDVLLLIAILLSILAVMLESVPSVETNWGEELRIVELVFTGIFTLEYLLRVYCVGKPFKYILSFYGLVDLLSLLPTYLGFFLSGYHSLSVIRSLRLIRVFRVFKLGRFLGEADTIVTALRSSRAKIIVFLVAVLSICMIMGTTMYLIESPETGFTSIPRSIYWAIVTLTTVGYGDLSPVTPLGQGVASLIMIMGYAIIAVPTGIVTSEINKAMKNDQTTRACPNCSQEGHDADAVHCKHCGHEL